MGRPLSLFRMHWDHEPIRFGPRAVPARSGRAKTRAWVIFPGVLARATRCDRGPVAVRYFAPANSGHGSWVEQDSGRRMGAVRKLVLCHGNAYTSDLRTDERAGFLAR